MEVDKGGEELDVVSTPGRQGVDLFEGADIVAGAGGADVSFFRYLL